MFKGTRAQHLRKRSEGSVMGRIGSLGRIDGVQTGERFQAESPHEHLGTLQTLNLALGFSSLDYMRMNVSCFF